MKFKYTNFKLCFLLLILMTSCSEEQRYSGPLAPEEALDKFQIIEGFHIELFASEPDVFDPVALEFDTKGNAYVVEMPDYPYEVEPGKGKGRIRMLKDNNGDGKIDESIVFAENLTEATSILAWEGGLLVTAAPNILFLKDNDGDGKSDSREVLFSGFFENNSEAQITSLRYGVDNWIYANNRGQHGEVSFNRKPEAPSIPMRGVDFRFRLDRNQFERETGPGQFGQTINDWGERFFTENSIHIQQAVIPWRYTHRHPYLPSTRAVANISDHEERMHQESEPPYWRSERTKERNETYLKNNMDRTEHAEDYFTAATGGTVYAADAYPKEFYGNIFTGDVSGHLVHRDILAPSDKSPVYKAQRAEKEGNREFLSSTDSWFRPADFTVGPEGYLYVIDMYRQHIETPVSIPDELKEDMDFLAGSNKGRIYKIVPRDANPNKNIAFNFNDADGLKLVELLSHPNQWWRLQAQRLLLERQDKSVLPEVKTLLEQSEDARTRLHALYTIEGLEGLNAEIVRKAIKDASPHVRKNGLILAERFPETLPIIKEHLDDPSIPVALQATLSLGQFNNKNEIIPAFAQVIGQYGQDPWFRMAVLSSDVGSAPELLEVLTQQNDFSKNHEAWKLSFIEDLSYIIGFRNQKDQISAYLKLVSQPDLDKMDLELQNAAITGLIAGMNKIDDPDPKLKEELASIDPDSKDEVVKSLKKYINSF